MVRPTYETEADLSREENIARYAARKWNCAMRKQDKYNQFDYLIIKGKDVKAFVEIRTRTHTRGTYPCLLYTSPSPRDGLLSRMPSSA